VKNFAADWLAPRLAWAARSGFSARDRAAGLTVGTHGAGASPAVGHRDLLAFPPDPRQIAP